MNGWQRLALVAGLVVLLFAVQQAMSPFRPAYQRAGCGSPLSEAFKADVVYSGSSFEDLERQFGITTTTIAGRIDWGSSVYVPPCRTPARYRLERSGILASLAALGTAIALLVLRDRTAPVNAP